MTNKVMVIKMTESKRYVRILDHSEKEVRIFDEHNQKNIFNIFFEGIDSAICLKGALEDTVDLLNELNDEKKLLKKQLGYRIALSQDYNNECDELFDENQELKEENEQLKQQLKEFKDYVFSDDEILCYSCVNCISKGIYEVECSVKGKVDVHGKCFSYWKDEVESRSD